MADAHGATRWQAHWNDLKARRCLVFESRHRAKDGRLFPVEINANYFEPEGQAYIPKDSPFDELVHAIRIAVSGEVYLSPKVADAVVADLTKEPAASGDLEESLTIQEREVLLMVVEGRTTKQIALSIHKSIKAVQATRRRVMQKLRVGSVAEMVRFAIKKGLTSVDS